MNDENGAEIGAFFARFNDASRELDVNTLRTVFSDTFLNADPTAVRAVEREAMLQMLPRRRAMFERAGAAGLDLVSVEETMLDERHASVRAEWSLRMLEGRPPAPLTVSSTFILRRHGPSWQILLSVYHQDIAEVLASISANADRVVE